MIDRFSSLVLTVSQCPTLTEPNAPLSLRLEGIKLGQRAIYRCPMGFILQGAANATCLASGEIKLFIELEEENQNVNSPLIDCQQETGRHRRPTASPSSARHCSWKTPTSASSSSTRVPGDAQCSRAHGDTDSADPRISSAWRVDTGPGRFPGAEVNKPDSLVPNQ